MRVAVIGAGIAGLGAAHALARVHDVEVFERDGRAGGHANTVTIAAPRRRRAAARHRIPRAQRAQLPATVAPLPRARRGRAGHGDVVRRELRALSPRVLGGAPLVAAAGADAAGDGAPARRDRPLHAHRRARAWRATTRAAHSTTTCASRATPARSATTSSCRSPRHCGQPPRPRPSRSPSRTRSASSRTTACWASAGTPGAPVAGGSRRYVEAVTKPLGTRLRLGAGVTAVRRDADGVELRTVGDTSTASTPR